MGLLTEVHLAPVAWWHGDADYIVPLTQARQVIPLIPCAELFVRPGESHLGGVAAAEEVLVKLLSLWGNEVHPTAISQVPHDPEQNMVTGWP